MPDGGAIRVGAFESIEAFNFPSEFRFVQSGETLLAGSYTGDSGSLFVSIEVLGFRNPPSPGTELVTYGQNMLDYFGNIEAAWVAMGGTPQRYVH